MRHESVPPFAARQSLDFNRRSVGRVHGYPRSSSIRERAHLPPVGREPQLGVEISLTVLASWDVMSKPSSRRFPVTVTQLPVTRCQICHRTVAYRPGKVSEVLTEHYRRAHPEALGIPSR
jgi:hypothetical protein